MAMQNPKPKLSLGNHIYFYQLLSEALGCGKQTLMPRVEEVLEAERMGAADLGFDDTRELLEALSDFVELTVFKGGRIYATIVAQPAWDEALAAPEKQQKSAPGKPWKRKKADKGLKPVRPRRAKRPEPEPEAAPDPEEAAAPEAAPAEALEAAGTVQSDMHANAADEHAPNVASGNQPTGRPEGGNSAEGTDKDAAAADNTKPADHPETKDDTENVEVAATDDESAENVADEAPKPAISLTVIYDPEHANAGMTTLVSTPGIAMADIEYASSAAAPAMPDRAASCEPNAATHAAPLPGNHAGTEARTTEAEAAPAEKKRTEPAAHAAGESAIPSHASTRTPDAPDARPHRAGRIRRHHTVIPAPAPSAPAPLTDAPATGRGESPASEAAPHHGAASVPAAQSASTTDAAAPGPMPPVSAATEPQAAPAEPAPVPAPEPQTAPAPTLQQAPTPESAVISAPAPKPTPEPEPELPAGYPENLTEDAFCPGTLLSEISYLLPLGADVMGILNEYYHIARLRGTLACSRNRATFPLGYAKDGVRSYATIRIRRNTASHGAPWLIDACTVDDDPADR